ncbi:hypothetical protein V6N13_007706 [Hibiscus sabdariffa]|uniref:Uncharacterized protein n=2 Tax=Hibiscus sabdariffa TaxID=183260 RepID=A0ABR2EMU9_9ROSI
MSVARSSHVDVPHRSSVVVSSTLELNLLSHLHGERHVPLAIVPHQTSLTIRPASPSLARHLSTPATSPNSESLRLNPSSGKLPQF